MKKLFVVLLCLFAMVGTLTGCSSNASNNTDNSSYTFADTVDWDGQYDVVVVGFGGAGAVAAVSAAEEGAKVLLVEKAPEGHEGGNTRYCGQLFAYGNGNEEATYAYYKALAADHEIPEAMLKVFTQGVAHLAETIAEDFGADRDAMFDWTGVSPNLTLSPEYPEFEGSESISIVSLSEATGTGEIWEMLRTRVAESSENIDVWFESPAVSLVQDPVTKTIVGVEIERQGDLVKIQANNGVVLATGGFENNPEMTETYLGLKHVAPVGTLYNTGDGVKMAMEAGADLWHMEVHEGIAWSYTFKGDTGNRARGIVTPYGSVVLVGKDGDRFQREDETLRHGHIYHAGSWASIDFPEKSFYVVDSNKFETQIKPSLAEDMLPNVYSGETIEDLAVAAGMNPEILANTISKFNNYATTGVDIEHDRAASSMAPITEGPFYAVEVIPMMLNTQGGPRRNENAEILDTDGNPIPHLYSAGELGGITSNQYQGGSNIAECFIFGKIAGKNAAAEKEALPAYEPLKKVESELTFTPGAVTDLTQSEGFDVNSVQLKENEYLGVGSGGMGGDIVVKVTMDGDSIANVEVLHHEETEGIGTPAIESLPQAIIDAQSTEVDIVSGATMTSKALIAAVQNALEKIGK